MESMAAQKVILTIAIMENLSPYLLDYIDILEKGLTNMENKLVNIQWAFIELFYKDGKHLLVTNYPSGILDAVLYDEDSNVIRTDKLTYEILCQHIAVNFPDIARIGIQ